MWVSDGTINVTNGSPNIVGVGTAWSGVVRQGWAWPAPDGKFYQVLTVNSDTSITLARNYGGSTATGLTYDLVPTQGETRSLAARVSDLIAAYAGFITTKLAGLFSAGSAATPGVAREGDANTGIFWPVDDEVAVTAGGVERFRVTGGVIAARVAPTTGGGASQGLSVSNSALTRQLNLGIDDANSTAWMQGWVPGLGASDVVLQPVAGNMGIGGTPTQKLQAFGPSGQGVVAATSTEASGATIYMQANGAAEGRLGTLSAVPLVFSPNAIERMRIDASGNVGIGLTPSAKLHAAGADTLLAVRASNESGNSLVYTENSNAGNAAQFFVAHSGAAVQIGNRRADGGGALVFFSSDTERMRIDGSGNWILRNPPSTPATLTTNGDLTVTPTSNTNLRFSYRGGDGVTRVANIPLA